MDCSITNLRYGMLISMAFLLSLIFEQPCQAQEKVLLYDTYNSDVPYRIPAIVKNQDGSIVAFADYRRGGNDVGSGPIDIKARISQDNGLTWGNEFTAVKGGSVGDGFDCAHGDVAVVCDRETGRLMMFAASGELNFFSSTRKNYMPTALAYSDDGGRTWTAPRNMEDTFYAMLDGEHPVKGMFVGSGKLTQSRVIKAGSHYRVYLPFCCHPYGNRVFYSDDFGTTWNVLGDKDDLPAIDGDEPKIEELPDGNVLLSSRMSTQDEDRGRIFNVFVYANRNKGAGLWQKEASSKGRNNGTQAISNNCNGEIMILNARRVSDGKKVFVALQSIPFGPNRTNVGIYYRTIDKKMWLSPKLLACNWEGRYQVSNILSCYSTMVLQNDNTIGFMWEENVNKQNNAYDIYYQRLTLEQITDGKYTIVK